MDSRSLFSDRGTYGWFSKKHKILASIFFQHFFEILNENYNIRNNSDQW